MRDLFSITTPPMKATKLSSRRRRQQRRSCGKSDGGDSPENATHAPVDFDTNIATTITAHGPGYIDRELETIVGLQTDKPLKRALHPYGGSTRSAVRSKPTAARWIRSSNTCLPTCVNP